MVFYVDYLVFDFPYLNIVAGTWFWVIRWKIYQAHKQHNLGTGYVRTCVFQVDFHEAFVEVPCDRKRFVCGVLWAVRYRPPKDFHRWSVHKVIKIKHCFKNLILSGLPGTHVASNRTQRYARYRHRTGVHRGRIRILTPQLLPLPGLLFLPGG